jgi:hypothetical protein
MKYNLKTIRELGVLPKEGELIVSITNNCHLTKGKTYEIIGIFVNGFFGPRVINNKGEYCSDMDLFVQYSDYQGALRDYRLRKIGI